MVKEAVEQQGHLFSLQGRLHIHIIEAELKVTHTYTGNYARPSCSHMEVKKILCQ